MNKSLKIIILSSILCCNLFTNTACMSSICVGARITHGNPDGEIYPATRGDTQIMGKMWDAGSWMLLLEVFPIIDLPFSLITDTLCLPYDIHCARERTESRSKQHPKQDESIRQFRKASDFQPTH